MMETLTTVFDSGVVCAQKPLELVPDMGVRFITEMLAQDSGSLIHICK